VDENELVTVAPAAEAADEAAVVVRHGDDLVPIGTHDDRIVSVAAPLGAPRTEHEQTRVLIVAHEGASALAHDLPVIWFLDHGPAAGFRVLLPLCAQILHVADGCAAGLGRLSGGRADTLESL